MKMIGIILVLGVAAGAQTLPDGKGQTLLGLACVQCHDLGIVASQRKTAPAWRRTVNEMIWRGAPLLPGEGESLAEYLARAFGPDSRQKTSDGVRAPAEQRQKR